MKSLFYSLALSALLVLSSCQYHHDNGEIFHTSYHISYQHHRNLQKGIESSLQALDASLSMFNPHSTLSRINQADTQAIDLSSDSLASHLIRQALRLSALTQGAFDITVAPLVNLWGFGYEHGSQPSEQSIDSILTFTGYRHLQLAGQLLRKDDARVKLDASAIAKGYACDVVAGYLESKGVKNYLVEIGGEICLRGHNSKGKLWTVGIDKPIDDPAALYRELQTAIQLKDKCMATSGNYRNYYINQGRKVVHTIDPASGYPVQHALLSASVVADNCLTADALATSFMVMGLERAIALLRTQPDVWGYFIYRDQEGKLQTWCSPALEASIIN